MGKHHHRKGHKHPGHARKTGSFMKIAKKAAKEYGSKEVGKKVAGSVMWKKLGALVAHKHAA